MSYYEEVVRYNTSREDRYRSCKILKDKETDENLLSTRDLPTIKTSSSDRYHEVKSFEEGRLDIIANRYYNNALLWWVIAEANDIFDPITEVTAGRDLRIPSIDTLYGYRGILL